MEQWLQIIKSLFLQNLVYVCSTWGILLQLLLKRTYPVKLLYIITRHNLIYVCIILSPKFSNQKTFVKSNLSVQDTTGLAAILGEKIYQNDTSCPGYMMRLTSFVYQPTQITAQTGRSLELHGIF